MAYIKNISHEEVLHLADQVSADKGQIVSKTLAQNDHVSVTLFAFSKDEEIATHDSTGDAMVLVLEGTGQFTVERIYFTGRGYPRYASEKTSFCLRKRRL